MANGFLVLNEKDWEKMTPEQREWAIFNTLQSMHNRLTALEKKGFFNKACATAGGMIGGALAALGFRMAA